LSRRFEGGIGPLKGVRRWDGRASRVCFCCKWVEVRKRKRRSIYPRKQQKLVVFPLDLHVLLHIIGIRRIPTIGALSVSWIVYRLNVQAES